MTKKWLVAIFLLALVSFQSEASAVASSWRRVPPLDSDASSPTFVARGVSPIDKDISPILAHRLRKMKQIMDDGGTARFSPDIRSLFSECDQSVELKISTLPSGGFGVFAKRDIKQGSIVSFYPVHGITAKRWVPMTRVQDPSTDNPLFVCCEEDKEYFADHWKVSEALEPKGLLRASVNPTRNLVNGWFSHLIRDAGERKLHRTPATMEYYKASKPKMNCMRMAFGHFPLFATIATRDIEKGEELFTCRYLPWCVKAVDHLEKTGKLKREEWMEDTSTMTKKHSYVKYKKEGKELRRFFSEGDPSF